MAIVSATMAITSARLFCLPWEVGLGMVAGWGLSWGRED